jgi:hypothetical protein
MTLDLSDLDLDGVQPVVNAVPSANVVALSDDLETNGSKSCSCGVPGCCDCSAPCCIGPKPH